MFLTNLQYSIFSRYSDLNKREKKINANNTSYFTMYINSYKYYTMKTLHIFIINVNLHLQRQKE